MMKFFLLSICICVAVLPGFIIGLTTQEKNFIQSFQNYTLTHEWDKENNNAITEYLFHYYDEGDCELNDVEKRYVYSKDDPPVPLLGNKELACQKITCKSDGESFLRESLRGKVIFVLKENNNYKLNVEHERSIEHSPHSKI